MGQDPQINEILRLMKVPGSGEVYILGSFGRYITLYSQQIRALNLIYSLLTTKKLSVGAQVAVIGAGAAGLTAAVAAARLGANVTVLEKLPRLMGVQKSSTQRFLHPHIYDWPNQEREGEAAGLPFFNWTAAPADEVAERIEREWMEELEGVNGKRIVPHLGVTDVAIEADENSSTGLGGRTTVTWNDPKDGPMTELLT